MLPHAAQVVQTEDPGAADLLFDQAPEHPELDAWKVRCAAPRCAEMRCAVLRRAAPATCWPLQVDLVPPARGGHHWRSWPVESRLQASL